MYDVRTIADYIIAYYEQTEWVVSNLKLQKILYFLQAQFLVSKNERLFDDEIEAWDFGPVVPSVYHEYKMFGSASIPGFNKKMPSIVSDDSNIINDMLDYLRNYSATQLTEITIHQKPWIRNYSKYQKRIIPVSEIKEYFEE